ncbi:uncharacterized protein L3040_004575 [Drepanopeziza brunnea f. sp. 'multigermtubi']|nr:hypothetical protein L3040_004575 [Drepanopeziza brunnea f. sp. 'multigermtubi']
MLRLVRTPAIQNITSRTTTIPSRKISSNFRQRSVVSSFICTSPQSSSGLTFALFKRSQDVATYRGKWAVCSGSIESTDASPLAAAKREIFEETKLSSSDISLLIRGKPFSLKDEALRTEWTIHPFAFQLRKGAKQISFDWEHSEFRFVKPGDLGNYEHVPQLEIGMKRVIVSPETQQALGILRGDDVSGAQALALKSLKLLLEMVRGRELGAMETSRGFWTELRWRAWHLAKNGRPAMAPAIEAKLFKSLDAVHRELIVPGSGGIDGTPLVKLKSVVESVIKYNIGDSHSRSALLAQAFVQYVKDNNQDISDAGNLPKTMKFVTLSDSGTVMQCLVSLIEDLTRRGTKTHVTVLESRPDFEGVAFVNRLLETLQEVSEAKKMVSFSIIPDASVASAVADADYVVFGGDEVLPNGDVSNKAGSCAAAVLAKVLRPNCRVVALFNTEKITGSRLAMDKERERSDENEVICAWPVTYPGQSIEEMRTKGFEIDVRNEYFEWVPTRFIDRHITERGLCSPDAIATLGAESEAMEKRIFGDL